MTKCVSGDIEYFVERNKRVSRLRITVNAEYGAVLAVPSGYREDLAAKFVRQKAGWIKERLKHLEKLSGCGVPRKMVEGEKLFFLGARYGLEIKKEQFVNTPGVELTKGKICVYLPREIMADKTTEQVRNRLKEWYFHMAARHIGARVEHYAACMGVKPAGVRIKSQKCRWGSCSSRGNLNFNWKLIMALPEVIDYVVVHELCHMKRMDHSEEFWRLVGKMLPDFRQRRRWLKEYGPALGF